MRRTRVNDYLAHKQHLLQSTRIPDVVQITRDIVALHATAAPGPYLSLWARRPGFRREILEETLYESRELVRFLCMRTTLHIVPSDEVPLFFQACGPYLSAAFPDWGDLLTQSEICQQEYVEVTVSQLQRRILDVLATQGPSTVPDLSRAVPELKIKVRHSVDKPYEGTFSVGSRLVPEMCARGMLVRARPRGTWRSSLYEYAALSDWLPGVELGAVTPQEARAWLVRRYLAAFGPATLDDVQWWTGFSKGEVEKALRTLGPVLVEVSLEGLGDTYLMLADDAQRLRGFAPADTPYVFFLPALDPYIMGYRDRSRFLARQHRGKVFDRAGNAMPTVWLNGRVVGAWGQREDGSVVYGLFEPVTGGERALIEERRQQLEGFLGGEYLVPRTNTHFTSALG